MVSLQLIVPEMLNGQLVAKPPGFSHSVGAYDTTDEAVAALREFVRLNWHFYLPVSGPSEDYPAFESLDPDEAVDIFFENFEDSGFSALISDDSGAQLNSWGYGFGMPTGGRGP